MKTSLILFIAYLIALSQSTNLRTKTQTMDCCCECPCCADNPEVKCAYEQLQDDIDCLVSSLHERDCIENKIVQIVDEGELCEHKLKCDIECAANHIGEYLEQSEKQIEKGACAAQEQFEGLSCTLKNLIELNNEQLEFLSTFSQDDCVQHEIKEIIKKIQCLEEEVYELICAVDTLQYKDAKFIEQVIINQNKIQDAIEAIIPYVVNLWPSSLAVLNNLSQAELVVLLKALEDLFKKEEWRVNEIHCEADKLNEIRLAIYYKLNQVFKSDLAYEDALECCERADLIKIYLELIELAKNCKEDHGHFCVDIPCLEFPPICIPDCDHCCDVECIENCPPERPCFPPPFELCPPNVCPPDCCPFERCPTKP